MKGIRDKLLGYRIGIAGLGGLGSNVAASLVRTGVKQLILVDYDRVEESNLNRQFYFRDQIGMKKTEALKVNLQRIYSDMALHLVDTKLIKGSMHLPFENADIVVEALDRAETKRDFLEDIQIHYPDKYLIGATGVAGVSPAESVKLERAGNLFMCINPNAVSSDDGELLSPMVTLMANFEANLVIRIINGDFDDKGQ